MQVREMKRDCQVETEQLGLKKTKHTSQVLSSPELIPVFVAWSLEKVYLYPQDGMLVHGRVTSSIIFADTHLYTWMERGTVRMKCVG